MASSKMMNPQTNPRFWFGIRIPAFPHSRLNSKSTKKSETSPTSRYSYCCSCSIPGMYVCMYVAVAAGGWKLLDIYQGTVVRS